jgi:predicted O-methyltransferase YrrM
MSLPRPAVTPDRVMQFAWSFAPVLMIQAAIDHGIFDKLETGPKTAEDLAQSAGVPVRGIRAIANALVSHQLLSKDAGGRYSLAPDTSTFLVRGKPSYLGEFFRHITGQLLPKWMKLSDIVRAGRPDSAVNQQDDGAPFFAEFVESLFPMSYPAAQALAVELGLARSPGPVRVLDLAAGSGVWSIALAEASPNVTVTAVDWPAVLETTRKVAARRGVADRYRFVAGDLLETDFGTGHNVATLGHILHSEGEARSRQLLRKTFDALAPGGVIAIQEFLADPERASNVRGLTFAVNMLVATDKGDTFSFEEIAGWLREIGFERSRLLDSPGPSPLILAGKPV